MQKPRTMNNENSRFGGGINSIKGIGRNHNSGTRTNVNNRSSLSLQHPRQNSLRDLGGSDNVNLNKVVEKPLVHFMEEPGVRVRNSHIVNQHSNVQPLNRFPNLGHTLVQIPREIDHHGLDLGFPELSGDRIRHVFKLVGVPTDEYEVEAFARELKSEAFSNAVSGSSNDSPRSVLSKIFGRSEEIDVDPSDNNES
ncbi:hypothetical protein V8G54_022368 [Vigna mungo]|uniref:Uncharacterized protein n=1 Tax=Vigna mungo TaxID=3915 RepID=A0AAQ3NHX3_VIGMU